MKQDILTIRKEYSQRTLDETIALKDPFKLFNQWFEEATLSDATEVNAMNLATVSQKGLPSSRIVLLKEIANNGFVFYTNYQSKKGKEMEANPAVALNFFWPELERQVQIQGLVEKVSKKESDDYFHSRPKSSQIGAWASPQSTLIASRAILEKREKELQEKYKNEELLPKPEQWGGYVVMPFSMEFWQGRPSRLHDRILYTLKDGKWTINRLAP
jgi:pyridoxamine 5'-phosphate oxidase